MKIFTSLLAFVLCGHVIGQPQLTLKISDKKQQPVSGATVHVLNSNIDILSDSSGAAVLRNLIPGRYDMLISKTGYADRLITIQSFKSNSQVSVSLDNDFRALDEVVVSAEKNETSLHHTPVSISNISAKKAQQLQLWNAKEITAIAPTLYAANPGDNRNVISIRGITSTSYDPAVSTYIDGVNQFNLDTYIADLIDIQRIEVLRGPQGTLYGRNAMGGVLNIITKPAGDHVGGFAEVILGNYDLRRYAAALNLPVVKNKLMFRIAGLYNSRDGYFSNTFNGSSYDKQHSSTLSYTLNYLVNPKLKITINAKNQFNKNNGAFPLIFGMNEALKEPFKLNQNAIAHMNDKLMNASLNINYTGVKFNFNSATAYQANHRYYNDHLDADFSALDGMSIYNNYGNKWNNVKAVTQEFRFTSTARDSSFNWVSGTYLFYQHNPVKQTTIFGKDAKLLGTPDSMFSITNTSTAKNSGLAVYGQGTIKITHALDLSAGLRYDHERKKLNVLSEYEKGFSFPVHPDTSSGVSFNVITPKIGLLYKVSSTSSVYINYSKGFRAGGLTQLSLDPSQPPLFSYKPEYSSNIELGIKNRFFNNRVSHNVSIFYIHVNNAQVPFLILPDAITVTKNAGKLRSIGIESELQANLFSGFSLHQSFGYTKARYRRSSAYFAGTETNLEGKKQIFTPDVTLMTGIKYEHSVLQNMKLHVGLEWYYLGEQYFDLPNTLRQSPYHCVNARAGISYKNLQLMFWSKNLTDTRYIDYAYDFGAVHLADPRRIGMELKARL